MQVAFVVGSLIWAAHLASADGANVGLNYIELPSDFGLNVYLLILLFGLFPLAILFFLGYILYLHFTLIQFGIRDPKRFAPALALHVAALVMMISILAVSLIGAAIRG